MTVAAIKSGYVLLEPVDPSSVPNNSIYVDSTHGNQMYLKNNSGVSMPVVGGESGYFIKSMVAGSAITQHQLVAKRSDGYLVPADSDNPVARSFVGYAQGSASGVDDIINVLLIGPNVAGAVSGLGFTPGDVVWMSQNAGGYINDIDQLTDDDDIIIKVGIADCIAGVASSTAVDLISFVEKEVDPP